MDVPLHVACALGVWDVVQLIMARDMTGWKRCSIGCPLTSAPPEAAAAPSAPAALRARRSALVLHH